jgi:hypothetical protein
MRRPVCKSFTSHCIFLLMSKQQAQLRRLRQIVSGYRRLPCLSGRFTEPTAVSIYMTAPYKLLRPLFFSQSPGGNIIQDHLLFVEQVTSHVRVTYNCNPCKNQDMLNWMILRHVVRLMFLAARLFTNWTISNGKHQSLAKGWGNIT